MKNKMINEKKRYWLMGGIIGLLIGGLIILHMITFGCNPIPLGGNINPCSGTVETTIALLEFMIMLPIMTFVGWIQIIDTNKILSFITFLAYFFLIGSLIGYIYGRIKNKNQDIK